MKKEYTIVLLLAVAAIALMCVGICIGEMQSCKLDRINRVEDILERTAEQSGYVSLGVIDGYAISQRNGYTYDGPAIRDELFRRAGLEVPENSWAFDLGEQDGIYLVRFVAYKGSPREPVTEQEVDQVYVYGVY